jgi:hypothetical protein
LRRLYRDVEIGKAACKSQTNQGVVVERIAERLGSAAESSGSAVRHSVLQEIVRREPDAARNRTVLLNLVYMIQIANSDLTGFLSWAVKLLIDNPDWAERLRLASGTSDAESASLASLTIKEILRLERSEFIFRKAIDEIDYKNFRIPKGWIVRVCIRDGHRDASVFPDPTAFDPTRFAERSYAKEDYSPLGIGAHSCLGGRVIECIGNEFLLAWCGDYYTKVLRDGPREYGRSHWQPNSNLRLLLCQRDIAKRVQ